MGLENHGKTGETISFAEQQERKAERAENRAKKYETKAEQAIEHGKQLQKPISDKIGDTAFFTQPNISSCSGRAFTRQREKMLTAFEKGFEEFKKSEYYAERAEIARETAKNAKIPIDIGFCERRIKDAEKIIKAQKKNLENHQNRLERIQNGETLNRYDGTEVTEADIINSIEKVRMIIEHNISKAVYYHDCIEKLGGLKFSRDNVHVGDVVRLNGDDELFTVLKCCPKNVYYTNDRFGYAMKSPYSEIAEIVTTETKNEPEQPKQAPKTKTVKTTKAKTKTKFAKWAENFFAEREEQAKLEAETKVLTEAWKQAQAEPQEASSKKATVMHRNKETKKTTDIFDEIASQINVLIAGVTGSGKSVLLNGLIHNLIQQSPGQCRLYLIDPKKIGLAKFQHLPHVDGYATDTTDIIDMMQEILDLMHQCYEMMSEWDEISKETPVYVMIDELADLMINGGSQFWKLLQSLNQLCRAANIHVIAATQSPAKKIIPVEITINFTCKIALHCDDTTQSRQILGVPGTELLPKHGKTLLKIDGKEIQKISIPYLDSETLKASVEAWQAFTPEPECETITIPEYPVRTRMQTQPIEKQSQADISQIPLEKIMNTTAKIVCFVMKHLIKIIALILGFVLGLAFVVLSTVFHIVSKTKIKASGIITLLIGILLKMILQMALLLAMMLIRLLLWLKDALLWLISGEFPPVNKHLRLKFT